MTCPLQTSENQVHARAYAGVFIANMNSGAEPAAFLCADLVSATNIGALTECITALLESRLVGSPLVHAKLVELLSSMLRSSARGAGGTAARALSLAVLGADTSFLSFSNIFVDKSSVSSSHDFHVFAHFDGHSSSPMSNVISAAVADARRTIAAVGTGAAQQHLLPALMRVYAAADAAVGLDVDKDAFDKFRCGARV